MRHATMIQDLLAQRAELDKQIAEAKTAALAVATANAIGCFTSAGFTADEALTHLVKRFKSGARKPKPPVAPKFRQVSGTATWTGRGVQPRWFKAGDYEAV